MVYKDGWNKIDSLAIGRCHVGGAGVGQLTPLLETLALYEHRVLLLCARSHTIKTVHHAKRRPFCGCTNWVEFPYLFSDISIAQVSKLVVDRLLDSFEVRS